MGKFKGLNKILAINTIVFAIVFNLVCIKTFAEPKLNDQKSQIENKRDQAKKQIHKLKLLEKIETNKLYKNQQKLEYNQHNLEKSKKQYEYAKDEVATLEKKLNVLLVEHNRHLAYTKKSLQ